MVLCQAGRSGIPEISGWEIREKNKFGIQQPTPEISLEKLIPDNSGSRQFGIGIGKSGISRRSSLITTGGDGAASGTWGRWSAGGGGRRIDGGGAQSGGGWLWLPRLVGEGRTEAAIESTAVARSAHECWRLAGREGASGDWGGGGADVQWRRRKKGER